MIVTLDIADYERTPLLEIPIQTRKTRTQEEA